MPSSPVETTPKLAKAPVEADAKRTRHYLSKLIPNVAATCLLKVTLNYMPVELMPKNQLLLRLMPNYMPAEAYTVPHTC